MRRIRRSGCFFCLGLAWAIGASAQPWRGTAALDVEVSDRGKRPLAGAEIHLQFIDAEPKAGPAPVATDSTGRVLLPGLAQGNWLLEVRYQGSKPYSAVLQLEVGKRAVVVAGPVRDAAAPPVNVKFLKAEVAAAIEPRRGRERAPEPAAPQPREAPPAQPAPPSGGATPSPPSQAPSPARPPAPAPPAREPAALPEPRQPPATAPTPPTREPAPSPAPPAAAPAPSAPELPPAPATPEPAPDAPAPAPPRQAGAPVRGARAGTCPECKQGEWAVSTQQAAGPAGRGSCDGGPAVRDALRRLAQEAEPSLAGYAGPLIDPVSGTVTAAAGLAAQTASASLAPYLDPAAPCQLLAVVLPREARYRGYGYDASDAERSGSCVGGEECEIGACAWTSHPVVETGPGGTIVFALFQNRSPDRERRARLTVYFSHPDIAWAPR